ncbi:aromatic ring-hydroxylating oxygenase subunit alpha [Sphingomicrobium aestuariivivum]|uniref:aromatic ring-hydroxylating oxygenase subunit alpha n=1 Tax=Sphingomicrobium aestuariivivum TaxID=1582356 RepID=UPI001FD70971|nr:aromatic ring-hydroxylating dioxygenase subunit alpha [Sphingomicrobium aestuariivivum]MCJ8190422.1 aromatic ring-hydroxylating dioxygenase subunit alpha [Sphingomicrobium aestuariivivum]
MDVARRSSPMTPGQRRLAEAMQRGDHFIGEHAERIETSRYVDPQRHERELSTFFRAMPTALCPSALVGKNEMVRHDLTGLDLIVTRDGEGQVHVLANSCLHRATRLVETDAVQPAKKIICPYHAWTYTPDGSLRALPRPDSFPGFCKEGKALTRYPVAEHGGLIWFIGDPQAQADFSLLEELGADLDAIGIGDMAFFERATHEVAADWKMVVDAFCEGYHVKRLHARSIGDFFADGVNVADRIGPHQRFIVGRTDHAMEVDLDDWDAVREVMTFTYQLFPNSIVIVSPDYVNLLVVHPDGVGRCRVENFMLVPPDADAAVMEPRWRKSWELLDGHTFGGEDFRAAALCQRGVESGHRDDMLIGTLETGVAVFHAECDARLEI